MRVVLVLILIVGAFLLGGWADHVYFLMPIGSSVGSGASAPPPAPAAQNGQTNGGAASVSTDMRSCLAEAANRHLEPGYARRMCQDIVNN